MRRKNRKADGKAEMKYKEAYDAGVSRLKEVGVEEAALDARLLLEHICHTNRNDLLAHGDRELGEDLCSVYFEGIARRESRVPLQHITGEQAFMGLAFEVNGHVLIPRQDTEILVEEAMRYLHDGMDILDLCTGSGCILLSLLHYSNGCSGVGTDLSGEALAVAERNGQRFGGNYRFIQGDLFEHVDGLFDMIVSNPPYIPTGEIAGLMEEVRVHEPLMALDGKEDGLYFYRKIAAQAGRYLRGGGYLFFEIGCEQAKDVKNIMEGEGFREITVIRDFAGLDRVVYGWNPKPESKPDSAV